MIGIVLQAACVAPVTVGSVIVLIVVVLRLCQADVLELVVCPEAHSEVRGVRDIAW